MKKIIISSHAELNMRNRGASEEEVISAIQSETWREAKRGKHFARKTIQFNDVSKVNGKHYLLKTIEPIFVDELNTITVVTVKVYYHNEN